MLGIINLEEQGLQLEGFPRAKRSKFESYVNYQLKENICEGFELEGVIVHILTICAYPSHRGNNVERIYCNFEKMVVAVDLYSDFGGVNQLYGEIEELGDGINFLFEGQGKPVRALDDIQSAYRRYSYNQAK